MAAGSIAAFWAVALLLIVVPGPDWAFTIGAGLRGGSAVPAVGGLVLGYAGMTIVVAAGVGTLVARSPVLLTGLTVAGALYLTWHGARTLARPAAPAAPAPASDAPAFAVPAPPGTHRATLIKGAGVSGLNPKGLLLFLALLPQFTGTGTGRCPSSLPSWAWCSWPPARRSTSASGPSPRRCCTAGPPPPAPSPGPPERR